MRKLRARIALIVLSLVACMAPAAPAAEQQVPEELVVQASIPRNGIDPKTNQVAALIAMHARSHLLASGYGSIWIPFETDGIVQRIDGRTGEVEATIQTNAVDMESDGDIAAGGGYIWIINRGSTVAQIDPTTNSVKGIFRPAPGTLSGWRVRYGAGSLWISGGSIFRISPPK